MSSFGESEEEKEEDESGRTGKPGSAVCQFWRFMWRSVLECKFPWVLCWRCMFWSTSWGSAGTSGGGVLGGEMDWSDGVAGGI